MHSVTGKLQSMPEIKQAKNGMIFYFQLSERGYNPRLKCREWTSYHAGILVTDEQVEEYYRKTLRPGAIVTVSGRSLRVDYKESGGERKPFLVFETPTIDYLAKPVDEPSQYRKCGNF